LRQIGGFLRVLLFPPTDRHDITEISLKVALHTITLNIWSFSLVVIIEIRLY
jgi:hypothetical protein